jgi:hypothetical protein
MGKTTLESSKMRPNRPKKEPMGAKAITWVGLETE